MGVNGRFWHRSAIVVDQCTNYEQHQPILLQTINNKQMKLMKKCHNYSNYAQSQMLFYMQHVVHDYCTKYEHYLPVLSKISQQTHIYEKKLP